MCVGVSKRAFKPTLLKLKGNKTSLQVVSIGYELPRLRLGHKNSVFPRSKVL